MRREDFKSIVKDVVQKNAFETLNKRKNNKASKELMTLMSKETEYGNMKMSSTCHAKLILKKHNIII